MRCQSASLQDSQGILEEAVEGVSDRPYHSGINSKVPALALKGGVLAEVVVETSAIHVVILQRVRSRQFANEGGYGVWVSAANGYRESEPWSISKKLCVRAYEKTSYCGCDIRLWLDCGGM